MLSEILFRNLDSNLKAVSLLITNLAYGLSPTLHLGFERVLWHKVRTSELVKILMHGRISLEAPVSRTCLAFETFVSPPRFW